MTSSCTSSSSSNFQGCGENPTFHPQLQWSPETHLLPVRSAWETLARNPSVSFVWWNAPRIWRDFGSALPFQTRLIQTKPVLSLSNEHGLQVKDHGRRQCCHNTHKNFLIGLHVMYLNFPDTPRNSDLFCERKADADIWMSVVKETICLHLQSICSAFSPKAVQRSKHVIVNRKNIKKKH